MHAMPILKETVWPSAIAQALNGRKSLGYVQKTKTEFLFSWYHNSRK